VAPFFEALEMGMAEKSVTRSIAIASHIAPEHIAVLYATLGALGLVAGQVKSEARNDPRVLNVDEVFEGMKAIAQTSGKGAIEQKSARLAGVLTHVDNVSARYVVRILLGNLRLAFCRANRPTDPHRDQSGPDHHRSRLSHHYAHCLQGQS
jgi:DNA ligase 1